MKLKKHKENIYICLSFSLIKKQKLSKLHKIKPYVQKAKKKFPYVKKAKFFCEITKRGKV